MSQVAHIRPHIKDITAPDELRNLKAWLIWRYEEDPDHEKPIKRPYYANKELRHGVQGSVTDREKMVTFEAAKTAAARYGFDGVGFALMPEFGIVALDFDNCMINGALNPEIEALVGETYAEYSPSGEGVRAFVKGKTENRKSNKPGNYGFETFCTKGFVTFTGNRLEITELLGNGNTIAPMSEDVRALYTKRFGNDRDESDDPFDSFAPRLGLTTEQLLSALDVLDPDMPREQWLAVGMALHHETEGNGFDMWDRWSKGGDKYRAKEMRSQWNSFRKTDGKRVTARTLVKMANANGARINMRVATVEAMEDVTPEENLRYKVVQAGEFAHGDPPSWIVKGVLPKAELVVLFGESGSGKSFFALDIVAAVARGVDWRGHRVKQGKVVYIAAEGGGGFRKRLSAYGIKHGIDLTSIPLGIIHATPNFLEKADAVDVGKAIIQAGKADVIVVDTFAQVTPGANENAGEDMGLALAHCRAIHKATGAVVILVHHAGKDPTKGARGWSGLRAAADAEIEVLKTVSGRMARISKQKDGDDNLEWGFDLEIVPVGMDEDGDTVDSCVVVEAAVPVIGKAGDKRALGFVEKVVMEVMNEITESQNAGIEVDFVIDEVAKRLDKPEGRDTRKQRAKRSLLALCKGDEAPFFLEDGCLSVV